MNLWDILNGRIIAVIPGSRIPRRPLLLQLLKQRQRMIAVKSPLAFAAAASNGGKVLNISTPISNCAWIIDSGATDHMTFYS